MTDNVRDRAVHRGCPHGGRRPGPDGGGLLPPDVLLWVVLRVRPGGAAPGPRSLRGRVRLPGHALLQVRIAQRAAPSCRSAAGRGCLCLHGQAPYEESESPDKASELEPVSGFEPLTCRLQVGVTNRVNCWFPGHGRLGRRLDTVRCPWFPFRSGTRLARCAVPRDWPPRPYISTRPSTITKTTPNTNTKPPMPKL